MISARIFSASCCVATVVTVTDLGVDVSPEHYVEQVRVLQPDVIGLSGLLTISYEAMQETVRLVRRLDDARLARAPIIIGGGMINAQICAHVGADYWAIDALVGVSLCKQTIGASDRLESLQ